MWRLCKFAAIFALCLGIVNGDSDDPAVVQKLLGRITEAGGSVACTKLADIDGIRGLQAACDFERDDIVMFIPTETMIIVSTANEQLRDKIPGMIDLVIEAGGRAAAEMIRLTLTLLGEIALGEKSVFADHIALLPKTAPYLISLGDEAQIKAMSAILPDAEDRRDRMLRAIAEQVEMQPDVFGHATEIDQRRAAAFALSRGQTFQLAPMVAQNMLVPWADLPNHHDNPNCRQDCDREGCVFVAAKPIKTGEQIFHSYVGKSDLHLLYSYGFVTGNSNSALRIHIEASEEVTDKCDGKPVKLHKMAPLAVEAESAECWRGALGEQQFLKSLFDGCKELQDNLDHPKGILTRGHAINPQEALAQLAARQPSHPFDNALMTAMREELAPLQRCISETQAALESSTAGLAEL